MGGSSDSVALLDELEDRTVPFNLEYTLGKEPSEVFSFFLRNLSLKINSVGNESGGKSIEGEEEFELGKSSPSVRIVYTCGIKEKKEWDTHHKMEFYSALERGILKNMN